MRSSWKSLSFECWKESSGVCAHVCVCSCVFLYMHMCVRVCVCVYACIHVCMCGLKLFIWEDNLEPFSPLHHYLQSSERGFELKYSRSTDLFELNVSTWCRICKEISFVPRFLRYEDKLFFISHNEFVVTICTGSRILVKEHFWGASAFLLNHSIWEQR